MLACVCSAPLPHASAQVVSTCGDLRNAFGPYDYRKDRGQPLELVESAHFTPEVETLIRGKSSNVIGQDIDYTLKAFPNHHRALLATARLAERQRSTKAAGMTYTVECYFERAIRWKSDDHVARMLFGTWLAKNGRRDEALAQLKFVDKQVGDNPITRFNLGLVYFDLKEYDAARAQAHMAMALGSPRTELRDKLKEAGQWVDPPAPADAAAPASGPASASSPASAATP